VCECLWKWDGVSGWTDRLTEVVADGYWCGGRCFCAARAGVFCAASKGMYGCAARVCVQLPPETTWTSGWTNGEVSVLFITVHRLCQTLPVCVRVASACVCGQSSLFDLFDVPIYLARQPTRPYLLYIGMQRNAMQCNRSAQQHIHSTHHASQPHHAGRHLWPVRSGRAAHTTGGQRTHTQASVDRICHVSQSIAGYMRCI